MDSTATLDTGACLAVFSRNSPETLLIVANLGGSYMNLSEHENADRLLREAVTGLTTALDEGQPFHEVLQKASRDLNTSQCGWSSAGSSSEGVLIVRRSLRLLICKQQPSHGCSQPREATYCSRPASARGPNCPSAEVQGG